MPNSNPARGKSEVGVQEVKQVAAAETMVNIFSRRSAAPSTRGLVAGCQAMK